MKIVEVEWIDAQTSSLQITRIDAKRDLFPIPSKSIGYLLVDEKKYIVLSNTRHQFVSDDDEDTFSGHIIIPRGLIKKINVLKEEKIRI